MDPLKDLLKDFAKGAGTYLKVVRFSEPTNPDGVIVLYLRPSDRFLLLGYWRGYEHSQAVGHWTKDSGSLHLKGHGRLSTDSLAPTPAGGRFERVFSVDDVVHTPCLFASEEMKGWGLLGWRGTYTYAGEHTIINPDGEWLPASLSEVDRWIEKGLARD